MGSDKFRGDPVKLEAAGKHICGERGASYESVTEGTTYEYKTNFLEIYSIIERLVSEDYLDPAAMAIANNIEGYKNELVTMTQTMIDYGNYCFIAADTIVNNQDDIIGSIPGGVN